MNSVCQHTSNIWGNMQVVYEQLCGANFFLPSYA
jgi:hypothetical protein